jgi:hypothetical protein
MRFRASGTDNATAGNYVWSGVFCNFVGTAVVGGYNSGSSSTGFYTLYGNTNGNGYSYIYSPQSSGFTRIHGASGNFATDASTSGGTMTVNTSYDGMTLLPASGTITGVLRIYGLKNS